MSVAMEVDEKTKSIDDLDLEPEHDFKSSLRSWCGLFVSVYHDRIYFLHQTAREFLLAERLSSNTIQELIWHGFVTMEDAHTALAECCVRFLGFLTLAAASLQTRYGGSRPMLSWSTPRIFGDGILGDPEFAMMRRQL
jgi:hypothetical protein